MVSIEENAVIGGAGSQITQLLATLDHPPQLLCLGLADHFVQHGSRDELLADLGLDKTGIIRAVTDYLDKHSCQSPALNVESH